MNLVSSVTDFKSEKPVVLTIGMFDGVHLGHQSIVEKLNKIAETINGVSALLTFFPHPRVVLAQKGAEYICLNQEKSALLSAQKLDHLIIQPFTLDFANLSSEEFVKNILVDTLQVHTLVVGYDHRFGKDRSGDYDLLFDLAKKHGFKVHRLEAVSEKELVVSSTKIRAFIQAGAVGKANQLLGYKYSLKGRVVPGDKIGRTLGFPTANLAVEKGKLIPGNGVYVVAVSFNGKEYKGMMNIGNRPTVNGTELRIEVHLFDFNQDIYGESIQVELLAKIRDERKFDSTEELKVQLILDEQSCLEG